MENSGQPPFFPSINQLTRLHRPNEDCSFKRLDVLGADDDTCDMSSTVVSIASLHVYPVKGAGGFSPSRWPLEERGLRHDRRFMLVGLDGVCITQRDCPSLARVAVCVEGQDLRIDANGCVTVSVEPTTGDTMPTRVWDDSVEAVLPSPEADRLLTRFLGRPCRLAYLPESAQRVSDAKRGEPVRRMSFADGAPVLIVAQSAVEELNARLVARGAPSVTIDRFRPNIVVRGNVQGDDDLWTRCRIGDAIMRVSTACKRCQVVTIDQTTGALMGVEPLRTLAEYRRQDDGIVFGRHALVDHRGDIAVGDVMIVA